MIIAHCCRKECGKEIEGSGAILWGHPNASGYAKKRHLCITCYKLLIRLFGLGK